jgi:catechol 2,3-dioxygenase
MTRNSVAPSVGIRPGGYRLPEDARIGRVRLQVSDVAASVAYYTQVLGFRVLPQSTGPERGQVAAVATLAPEGGPALIELHERRDARPVPRRGRIGLYHFAILLPDRAALGRFVAHLGDVGVRAGSADHLVSEALYLNDPDGLGIEVYADRPRAAWQVRGGQIAMATDPLDIESLVRAGGSEPWTGMPAGTTIGHVHFHVTSLDQAEAFYHRALGLDKVVWSYPGALFFSAGGYHHHVGTNTWAAGAPIATPDDARLLEWEVLLPTAMDTLAASANLANAGYDVRPDGSDRLISDSSGITVRLTQRSNQ